MKKKAEQYDSVAWNRVISIIGRIATPDICAEKERLKAPTVKQFSAEFVVFRIFYM